MGNWDKGSGWIVVTDAEHYIEIHLERETGDGTDDGRLRVWVDGVLRSTTTTVDNFTIFGYIPTYWYIGAISGIDAGTSGTLYLDEFKANDDGSEIGALGGSDNAPEFTPTGLLLAMMGSLGVYFFLQRNWRLAEERRRMIRN